MSSRASARSGLRPPPAAARSSGAGHRVLLVRPWGAQPAGSGCCGGAGGITSPDDAEPVRGGAADQVTGAAYRELRTRFPGLELTVVDSRNWAWLVPAVYRDARRGSRSRSAALRAAVRATTPGCLVFDGEVRLIEVTSASQAVAEVDGRFDA